MLHLTCLLLATFFLSVTPIYNGLAQEYSAPVPLKEGSNIYIEQSLTPFPDIRFYNRDKKLVYLSHSNGTLRLVNFWATWCAPCIREMPALVTLQEKMGHDLHIMTISEDHEGFKAIEAFIRERKLEGLDYYWDKQGREFSKLRMRGLPMSFLIDQEGNLIATIQGETDWLDDEIESLIIEYSR